MEEYAEIGVGGDRLKNVVVELVEEAGLVADTQDVALLRVESHAPLCSPALKRLQVVL